MNDVAPKPERQREPCHRREGCTRYVVDEEGQRVESPQILMRRARTIMEAFATRPGKPGAPVVSAFEDEPEAAFRRGMEAVGASFLRPSLPSDEVPWGIDDEGRAVEVLSVEWFGLCQEHARQVARGFLYVMFLQCALPTTHASDWKSFYTVGTISQHAAWVPYATGLLLLGRGTEELSAEEFDSAVAGLRIFIARLEKALPVAVFASTDLKSITRLFRSSGPDPKLDAALYAALCGAVARREPSSARELMVALTRVKRDFAARRKGTNASDRRSDRRNP